MNECSFIETRSDQTKFRLNKIMKLKTFNSEIWERKIMSKKLSKYIAAFDYFDKTLIVLSARNGRKSIIYFASVLRVPVGIANASFSFLFSVATGIIKKMLEIPRNKNKKHKKIVMLAKSKLNKIETLISQILIDLEISHEEIKTIVKEREKHEKMKENITIRKSSGKLNKEEDKKIKTTKLSVKIMKMHRIIENSIYMCNIICNV